MLRNKLWYIASTLAVVVAAISSGNQTANAAAIVNKGFFEGRDVPGKLVTFNPGPCGKAWHKVWCGGISDYSGNKEGFINKVMSELEHGSSQNKLGAAFIIFTMLGRSSSSSRTPSATQIAEWKERIRDDDIEIISKTITKYPNSAYVRYAADGVYDIAYVDEWAVSDPAMIFRSKDNPSTEYYYIKLSCANPIGDTDGLPKSSSWDASGTSTVTNQTNPSADVDARNTSATIGDTVKFTHRITNIGDASVDDLEWTTRRYKNDGSSVTVTTGSVDLGTSAKSKSKIVSTELVTLDSSMGLELGDEFCRFVRFKDKQGSDSLERSPAACVRVSSNYDLYPKVTIPSNVLFPGTEQEVTQNVINNNSFAPERDSPYAVQEYVIKAGSPKPTDPNVANVFNITKTVRSEVVHYAEAAGVITAGTPTACDWLRTKAGFNGISVGCKLLTNGNRNFNSIDNLITDPPIIADDYNVGDVVCRIVSLGYFKYDTTDTTARRVSKPICVTIAKSPHVQVWGHDVRVGDSIYGAGQVNGPNDDASIYTKLVMGGSANYGSWAEYGIFAPTNGVIRSVSGGAIASAPAKPLSFANTTTPDSGQWSPARTIASIIDVLPDIPVGHTANGTINLNQDLNGSLVDGEWYRVKNSGNNVTIKDPPGGGYDTSRGTMVIDMTEGAGNKTVTIDSDIILSRPDDVAYSKLGNAVQIVIVVKGNIIINSNVSRIDAWLVALPRSDNSNDGIISTCDEITTPYYKDLVVSGSCNQNQLVINGAVMAKQIQLRRTHGSEKSDYGKPAEIINLRPDAYMWGRGTTGITDGTGYPIRTIKTRELPPRF